MQFLRYICLRKVVLLRANIFSLALIIVYLEKKFRNTFLFELTNNISANREVWPLKGCVKQKATTLKFCS